MYRDIIGAPEKIEAAGTIWWTQQFNKWDGSLDSVLLFDQDGNLVAEFESMEEIYEFLSKVQPRI